MYNVATHDSKNSQIQNDKLKGHIMLLTQQNQKLLDELDNVKCQDLKMHTLLSRKDQSSMILRGTQGCIQQGNTCLEKIEPRHARQPHPRPRRRPGGRPGLRLDTCRRSIRPLPRPRNLHGARFHGQFSRFPRGGHSGGELPDALPGGTRKGLYFGPPMALVPGRRRV